jgi:hypothetical protein
MEEALRALLTGSGAVTAVVPAAGINFARRPQGAALPQIVLNVISRFSPEFTLDGAGLYEARVQADCYGKTYAAAKTIERAVVARLQGYSGGAFQMIELMSVRDLPEEVAGEPLIHRVSMDFRVTYTG